MALVPVAELVYASCSVHQLKFTSIEWVRFVRDLQLHQRILISVFKLGCVLGLSARTTQKLIAVTHVLEHDHSVILWMDFLLHTFLFWGGKYMKVLQEIISISNILIK